MDYGHSHAERILDLLVEISVALGTVYNDEPIKFDSSGIDNLRHEFEGAREFFKTLPKDDRLWKDYDIKGIIERVYPAVLNAIDGGELIIV